MRQNKKHELFGVIYHFTNALRNPRLKFKFIALIVALCINAICVGQSTDDQSDTLQALKSIEDLSFMEGNWSGTGWIMIARERKTFVQTESIEARPFENILVVEGLGYDDDSSLIEKRIIHSAFGVISFNEEIGCLTMLSFSTTGGKMENEIVLTGDKKLEWSFKNENGMEIRFREDFSKEGYWLEVGEYSFDGGEEWVPFFEMTLKRICTKCTDDSNKKKETND
ncbi:MAG: hypothetical protein MI810_21240 [Flavobacteriales bacterium]|nr:hypothetical protein [Flavobacteriales bacterium]